MLALGVAAAALIARATSRPIRRLEEAARRVEEGDLTRRGRGGGEQRAALARSLLQPDDVPDLPDAPRPAAVRRRRLASAAHPPHRHPPRARGAPGGPAGGRRAHRRGSTPGSGRSTGSPEIVDELLILSRAGERGSPVRGVRRGRGHRADRRPAGARPPPRRGSSSTVDRRGDAGTCVCARDRLRAGTRRSDRERDPVLAARIGDRRSPSAPERVEVLDAAPASSPARRRRSSSGSIAAARAPGTRGPASACRSPASWPASGAAR